MEPTRKADERSRLSGDSHRKGGSLTEGLARGGDVINTRGESGDARRSLPCLISGILAAAITNRGCFGALGTYYRVRAPHWRVVA